MTLSSFPRAGQFVASNYESRGGKRSRKENKKTLNKKRAIRKTKRSRTKNRGFK